MSSTISSVTSRLEPVVNFVRGAASSLTSLVSRALSTSLQTASPLAGRVKEVASSKYSIAGAALAILGFLVYRGVRHCQNRTESTKNQTPNVPETESDQKNPPEVLTMDRLIDKVLVGKRKDIPSATRGGSTIQQAEMAHTVMLFLDTDCFQTIAFQITLSSQDGSYKKSGIFTLSAPAGQPEEELERGGDFVDDIAFDTTHLVASLSALLKGDKVEFIRADVKDTDDSLKEGFYVLG